MLLASCRIYYSHYSYFTRKPGGNASRDTYWLISCCTFKNQLNFLQFYVHVGMIKGSCLNVGTSLGRLKVFVSMWGLRWVEDE